MTRSEKSVKNSLFSILENEKRECKQSSQVQSRLYAKSLDNSYWVNFEHFLWKTNLQLEQVRGLRVVEAFLSQAGHLFELVIKLKKNKSGQYY